MNRRIEIASATLAALFTIAAILPLHAHAEQPVEIVRPGDREMSCVALATEINQLGAPEAAAAKPAKKHGGLGFLKVLGTAAPLAGGLGMTGGMVAGVAGAAMSSGAQGQVQDQMADAQAMAREAMAGGSPAQQRKARLTAIFDDKHC